MKTNRLKRLRNTTDFKEAEVRRIIDWIAEELGITNFDVTLTNCSERWNGRAYHTGWKEAHGNSRPFVVLRIESRTATGWNLVMKEDGRVIHRHSYPPSAGSYDGNRVDLVKTPAYPQIFKPYQLAHHKGHSYWLADRTEALVYLAAHELRHLWQAARMDDKRKSKAVPLFHGARGQFSEVDTESFAIHMLRRWRRAKQKDSASRTDELCQAEASIVHQNAVAEWDHAYPGTGKPSMNLRDTELKFLRTAWLAAYRKAQS